MSIPYEQKSHTFTQIIWLDLTNAEIQIKYKNNIKSVLNMQMCCAIKGRPKICHSRVMLYKCSSALYRERPCKCFPKL